MFTTIEVEEFLTRENGKSQKFREEFCGDNISKSLFSSSSFFESLKRKGKRTKKGLAERGSSVLGPPTTSLA